MSKLLIALCLILSCAILLVNGQTYSNCKVLGTHKVEWTVSNATLSARFTIPSSTGYAAVGLKNTGSGMAGSTILIASGSTIKGEYYASGNSEPTTVPGAPFYTSASSSISGSTTTITLVRPLTRPGNSPGTYYSIVSGTSMDILFASHSSSAYPAQHTGTYKTTLNFFASSSCTSTSSQVTNSASSMRQGFVYVVLVVLALVGLLVC